MVNERRSEPTRADRSLAIAPEGWLESKLALVSEAALLLGKAATADDVLREAVVVAQERLEFNRIGTWFFEDDGKVAIGAYGVDENARLCDERGHRIFDRTGVLARMREHWERPPFFFVQTGIELCNSRAEVVGTGNHVTVPMIHDGKIMGFMAADDLCQTPVINDKVGYLLLQYAHVVSSIYFHKLEIDRTQKAEQALEQAERMKSEFLGMMGHEIRTPLNAIMGYAQLLEMNCTLENARSLSRTISSCSEHLTSLINGILEYSHLSDSDLTELYKPCDLIEVCRSTVDSFSQAYERKGVVLRFSHEGTNPGLVNTDAVAVRQVVGNLLQNALKFTDQGEVKVAVQSQLKSLGTSEFFISIEDEGIGIDPAHLQDIFKPFKQLDSSLTRKAGGIGMGLAIVERLVKALGGKLECESERGKGTKFTIDFLFQNALGRTVDERFKGESKLPQKKREEVKILTVEDHAPSAQVLLKMIEGLEYPKPDTAAHGAIAKRMLRERPYDLVLMDVEMPYIDGLSLTRQIRAGECGPINRDVTIVGVTAYAMKANRDTCLIAGMDDYILKPLKMEQLKQALERCVVA
ncbi:ATP-binding protein [Pelagicoccus sp. SDUM812003]|uniref:hybrid sensor histidine kinase/response regulator n=1 Tax=Pelagicoccus sp. SDUM812003 TaxID=3041267 RepID=UPI00280CF3DB|nr:ATP-binding protein [Pelagicoccus sp. SDUM812003]MDQ8202893.1 ATP-binding protein [Pelagicoccus sp. SDUM812003]